MGSNGGPERLRSIAVTAEDVVTAVEARRQRDRDVVLRVTPPYSGRMRARLHVQSGDDETDAIHVDPTTLLAETAPSYPRAVDTEDALRSDPEVAYTVERHRERHAETIESWREAVRDHVLDEVAIDASDGRHTVAVVVLG
jgi:hypothetical protein